MTVEDKLIVEVALPTKGQEVLLNEAAFRRFSLELRSSDHIPCDGILLELDGLFTVMFVPSKTGVRLDGKRGAISIAGAVPMENGPLDKLPGTRFVTLQTAIVPLVFPLNTKRPPAASELRLAFLGRELETTSSK